MSVVYDKKGLLVKAIVTIDNKRDISEMKRLDHCKRLLSGICFCIVMIVFIVCYRTNIISISSIWSFIGSYVLFKFTQAIMFISLTIMLKIDEETNSIYKKYGFDPNLNRDKRVEWKQKA